MKYLVIFTFFVLFSGCGSNKPASPSATSNSPPVYVDFAKLEDKETAPFYLAYSISKSTWEPTYLSDGSQDRLAQEVYARTMMLRMWKEAKENDPTRSHPVLDAMENILDAGYLREVTWLKHRDALNGQPDDLDIAGFMQWIDENPDKLAQADSL